VWEAPNREMATDWRVSPGGGGNDDGQKHAGDHGDPSVRGRWTESREAVACLSAGAKERGEKGNGTATGGF
jgi:hypothetical protein